MTSIVHTVNAISSEASGPSYSVRRLCESLLERDEPIRLATLDWGPMSSPPTFLRTFPLGPGPRRIGHSPSMRNWLFEQARARAIRLLHMHGLWMMPSVYPGEVVRKFGIPMIAAPRGTLSRYAFRSGSLAKRVFWPLRQRRSLEAATCFHATAEAEYADIRRMGFRQPVAIIPNAVDLAPLASRPPRARRTLLYVGRLHPEKGVDTLLDAWKHLFPRYPDWQLRIVGPDIGRFGARMRAYVDRASLQRVDFAGPLYGEEKQAAYDTADLFVMLSPSENFGVSVAEALAAGTPAVVAKGAPWSGLDEKRAGWWIDRDMDSIVATLEYALDRAPEELHEMGRRGRAWMESEYSWPMIARQTSDTYRWLEGGPRPECVIES